MALFVGAQPRDRHVPHHAQPAQHPRPVGAGRDHRLRGHDLHHRRRLRPVDRRDLRASRRSSRRRSPTRSTRRRARSRACSPGSALGLVNGDPDPLHADQLVHRDAGDEHRLPRHRDPRHRRRDRHGRPTRRSPSSGTREGPFDAKCSVYVFAAFFVVTAFLLARTTFGRYVYAVGGNAGGGPAVRHPGRLGARRLLRAVRAARRASPACSRRRGRRRAQADLGIGLELSAIAAAVVGGDEHPRRRGRGLARRARRADPRHHRQRLQPARHRHDLPAARAGRADPAGGRGSTSSSAAGPADDARRAGSRSPPTSAARSPTSSTSTPTPDSGRQEIVTAKADTTPPDFERGVLDVIAQVRRRARRDRRSSRTAPPSSSTRSTERKGVTTGLITTEGFRDSLEIARGNRPDFFNLFYAKPAPFVPRYLRREVAGRLAPDGRRARAARPARAAGDPRRLPRRGRRGGRDLPAARLREPGARAGGARARCASCGRRSARSPRTRSRASGASTSGRARPSSRPMCSRSPSATCGRLRDGVARRRASPASCTSCSPTAASTRVEHVEADPDHDGRVRAGERRSGARPSSAG